MNQAWCVGGHAQAYLSSLGCKETTNLTIAFEALNVHWQLKCFWSASARAVFRVCLIQKLSSSWFRLFEKGASASAIRAKCKNIRKARSLTSWLRFYFRFFVLIQLCKVRMGDSPAPIQLLESQRSLGYTSTRWMVSSNPRSFPSHENTRRAFLCCSVCNLLLAKKRYIRSATLLTAQKYFGAPPHLYRSPTADANADQCSDQLANGSGDVAAGSSQWQPSRKRPLCRASCSTQHRQVSSFYAFRLWK